MSRRGYTLIELLVCLAIISLVAGLAVSPHLARQRARQLLLSTIINLSNDLRAARFAAMAEGRAYRVEVFIDNYVITASAPGRWELIKRVYWPEGLQRVGAITLTFTFPASGLYGLGELDNGSIYLKNKYGQYLGVVISVGGRIRIDQPIVK
ncbi:MAG TPA: prepilin-type N-terminal cleavage/methylation domain-containing protein [Firmicutes bacterium]|nr:prepilin-type N-terminal cleavage/methylation domain-containing protein [Bacillota bacterium]